MKLLYLNTLYLYLWHVLRNESGANRVVSLAQPHNFAGASEMTRLAPLRFDSFLYKRGS